MPINFQLIKEKKLLLSVYTGEISNFELLSSYECLMKSPEFVDINCEVVDMRNCSMADISNEAFKSLCSMAESYFQEKYLEFRTAVIVVDALSFGLARQYKSFSEQSPESVMIFINPEKALEWLSISDLEL